MSAAAGTDGLSGCRRAGRQSEGRGQLLRRRRHRTRSWCRVAVGTRGDEQATTPQRQSCVASARVQSGRVVGRGSAPGDGMGGAGEERGGMAEASIGEVGTEV